MTWNGEEIVIVGEYRQYYAFSASVLERRTRGEYSKDDLYGGGFYPMHAVADMVEIARNIIICGRCEDNDWTRANHAIWRQDYLNRVSGNSRFLFTGD